jgi:hypothetical protein
MVLLPTVASAAIDGGGTREEVDAPRQSSVAGSYILVLREPALASYRGGRPGLAAPGRSPGSARLDVRGSPARAYVAHLQERQRALEARIASVLRRSPHVSMHMQHAINAIVVELAADEVEAVRALPDVLMLSPATLLELDTDVGPALIGAEPIWNGSNPGSSGPAQGEGKVIGVIDSGINWGSPSFAAVDPVDGHAHVNPLGSGNYLGTCAPGGVDEGRCNDKLIGGHDFVCAAPGNACTNAGFREEPGFGDTNGHGTHVASTAAGNRRDVQHVGNTVRIAGVAPRANIIAYDACYTEISTGRGLCPNTSTTASINQAVADGVVDVINYSIGGGTSPWTDAVSLAFLGAVDAGIYVAASAGNSGPGPNTMGHLQPWVASTAAAQHGRGDFVQLMSVTGPAPVPANLAPLVVTPGSGGVSLSATIPSTTPLRISAGIDAADDGCAAYPANTFAGAIAVIRRGTCSFSIKVNNASAAGAIAVVIANNQAGVIAPSVPGTTVPVFSVLQSEGNALRDFGQANPVTATATLPFPPIPLPNTPDQLGAFSSRGPAGEFDLVKPDLTAPGVRILAASAGTSLTGSEALVTLLDGTSMASPHHAGAVLLLRQLRPDWTVPELKSALQMTATRSVLREDGSTPATPFDMGAGRVRVNFAANAGLLLAETTAAFQAGNPATGGDPSTLNLASLGERYCILECQFVRRFHNPGSSNSSWTAAVSGLTGSVSPASFTVAAGATIDLTITIDSSALPQDGLHRHGWLELSREGGSADDGLSLPVSVSVPPAVASLAPGDRSLIAIEGEVGTTSFTVGNNGGFPLSFAFAQTGIGSVSLRDTPSTGVASGFRSTTYTDPATAGSQAQYAADDLVIRTNTQIRSIRVEGFTVSGAALTTAATNLTFSIYPDAGGLPAGNPQTNPAAAVWTYTTTPTGPGVTTVGSSSIALDFVAAGQNVNLPPGRYWVVVNTRGTFANRYAWYGSNTQHGLPGFASLTVATNGTGNWVANPSFPGLTLRVVGDAACNAPWIVGATPASGSLLRGTQQTVSVDLGALAAGQYEGAFCLSTNDPALPRAASMISVNVISPPELVFTTEPSATVGAGEAFAVQPVVTMRDSSGNTVTGYTLPVTLELATGTGPLLCDVNPVMPVNGVASFAGCRIIGLGTATLRARAGSVTDSTTNPMVVVGPGSPAQLVFAQSPSASATTGAAFAVQPVIHIQDAYGNLVDTATLPVALRVSNDAAPLACDANPVQAVGGVAAFGGCRIDGLGSITLDASTTGIASAMTQPGIAVIDVPPTTANSFVAVAYNAPATNVPLNLGGGAPTSVAIVTTPTNGTAIATGTTITYQPDAGYAGPDSFTYTATNSGGTSAPATVSVTVQDPVVTITAAGGFAATVAVPYTQTFTFNGGAQPWSGYQVTNLPAGLSITGTTANTVTISGTPTQADSFNLNVSATDSSTGNGPYTVGQAFALTVAVPTLLLTPATLPAATAGTAYSQTFVASGGIAPYAFTLGSGALPPGLGLAANGTLSGSPTTAGSFDFGITATDSTTGTAGVVTGNYTLQVDAPTIVLGSDVPTRLTVRVTYNVQLAATGGASPYSFAVTSGVLPTGLSLSAAGVLSGTPSLIGQYPVVITVTDANGFTVSSTVAFRVIAEPVMVPAQSPGALIGMILLLLVAGSVVLRRAGHQDGERRA